MSNKEKYSQAFCKAFDLKDDELTGLKYQAVEAWDSVGHMELIAELEDAFEIMMEADDIIELSSFEKGMDILTKNYSIEF